MSIFIHDNSTQFRLEVRGTLDALAGSELIRIYQTARTSLRDVPAILDLTRIATIEPGGHDAIDFLQSQGVITRHAEPVPEAPCWRTLLRTAWQSLSGAPQPALAPATCPLLSRFTRR